MSLKTFFDNFESLLDVPNGVQKLRELILQLAFQGKLVPQDPTNEPASVLLAQIKSQKERLIKEKKIRKDDPLPLVREEEKPFNLPNTWEWAYLDQVSNTIHYGYTASANPTFKEVRLLRITDIQNSRVDWTSVPGCEIDASKLESYELSNGDLLIARTGGTIGKSYLVESLSVRAVFASYLIRIIPSSSLLPKYLKLFLESALYWKQLYAKSMGTGQPNVNATSLKSLFVPVAPSEEQKRIVAKIDKLMALCDELETCQKKRREGCVHLNSSAIDQLLTTRTPEDFSKHWQRICDNFDLLYSAPENIGKLRQAILQLAVQGKLVLHVSSQKSVGISKEQKVSDFLKIQNGYAFKSEWFVKDGIRLLRNVNVAHGSLRWDNVAKVTKERVEEFKRFKLDEGDIVISLDRPLITTGLKVALITKEDLPCLLLQRVGKVEFKTDEVEPEFFFLWLQSPAFIDAIDPGRSNGVPHISSKSIEALSFTPPPKEEQKRIVAKVNQLMALCDELEAKLIQSQTDNKKLMDATVRQVLVV